MRKILILLIIMTLTIGSVVSYGTDEFTYARTVLDQGFIEKGHFKIQFNDNSFTGSQHGMWDYTYSITDGIIREDNQADWDTYTSVEDYIETTKNYGLSDNWYTQFAFTHMNKISNVDIQNHTDNERYIQIEKDKLYFEYHGKAYIGNKSIDGTLSILTESGQIHPTNIVVPQHKLLHACYSAIASIFTDELVTNDTPDSLPNNAQEKTNLIKYTIETVDDTIPFIEVINQVATPKIQFTKPEGFSYYNRYTTYIHDKFHVVYKDDKSGIIDLKGNVIVPIEYKNISVYDTHIKLKSFYDEYKLFLFDSEELINMTRDFGEDPFYKIDIDYYYSEINGYIYKDKHYDTDDRWLIKEYSNNKITLLYKDHQTLWEGRTTQQPEIHQQHDVVAIYEHKTSSTTVLDIQGQAIIADTDTDTLIELNANDSFIILVFSKDDKQNEISQYTIKVYDRALKNFTKIYTSDSSKLSYGTPYQNKRQPNVFSVIEKNEGSTYDITRYMPNGTIKKYLDYINPFLSFNKLSDFYKAPDKNEFISPSFKDDFITMWRMYYGTDDFFNNDYAYFDNRYLDSTSMPISDFTYTDTTNDLNSIIYYSGGHEIVLTKYESGNAIEIDGQRYDIPRDVYLYVSENFLIRYDNYNLWFLNTLTMEETLYKIDKGSSKFFTIGNQPMMALKLKKDGKNLPGYLLIDHECSKTKIESFNIHTTDAGVSYSYILNGEKYIWDIDGNLVLKTSDPILLDWRTAIIKIEPPELNQN